MALSTRLPSRLRRASRSPWRTAPAASSPAPRSCSQAARDTFAASHGLHTYCFRILLIKAGQLQKIAQYPEDLPGRPSLPLGWRHRGEALQATFGIDEAVRCFGERRHRQHDMCEFERLRGFESRQEDHELPLRQPPPRQTGIHEVGPRLCAEDDYSLARAFQHLAGAATAGPRHRPSKVATHAVGCLTDDPETARYQPGNFASYPIHLGEARILLGEVTQPNRNLLSAG